MLTIFPLYVQSDLFLTTHCYIVSLWLYGRMLGFDSLLYFSVWLALDRAILDLACYFIILLLSDPIDRFQPSIDSPIIWLLLGSTL